MLPFHYQMPLGLVGRFIHLQNVQGHFGIGSPKFTAYRVPHPKGMTLSAPWSSLPVCRQLTHSPEWESRASLGHTPAHISHKMDPCTPLGSGRVFKAHKSHTASFRQLGRAADLGTANLKKLTDTENAEIQLSDAESWHKLQTWQNNSATSFFSEPRSPSLAPSSTATV